MAQQSKTNQKLSSVSAASEAVDSRQNQKKIRRWRIMIPVVYLFFLLFFYLITSLSLASGSMFLIIFGPLLAVFCLISGPPLIIAFKRPDALYSAEKPPVPESQRKLCLILLCADLFAVILFSVLWLIF